MESINNMKELQKEKGIYYPYIMQILEAPVINGVLICETPLRYFRNSDIEGVAERLSMIRGFEKLNKEEFRHSMMWAIADLFCGGCEPEDIGDEDFAFLYRR